MLDHQGSDLLCRRRPIHKARAEFGQEQLLFASPQPSSRVAQTDRTQSPPRHPRARTGQIPIQARPRDVGALGRHGLPGFADPWCRSRLIGHDTKSTSSSFSRSGPRTHPAGLLPARARYLLPSHVPVLSQAHKLGRKAQARPSGTRGFACSDATSPGIL